MCTADQQQERTQKQAFAAELLQQMQVRELAQALEQKAEGKIVLPESEVRDMARQHGIDDPDEIGRVLGALQTTGAILRYHDKFFIRAAEVADMLVRALPDTQEEAEVCDAHMPLRSNDSQPCP